MTGAPDPSALVRILEDVPELERPADAAGPVLVTALDGFLDAGNAGRIAVDHMLDAHVGRVVAEFELDVLYDYRARRPAMTFLEDHYEDYAAPRLVVRMQRDREGEPFLLLHGPEPDTHWEGFCAAVRRVVEHFGVRETVSLAAVPMAVPHTRPMMATQHATRPELMVTENIWRGAIRIPASAMSLLELRLGEWDHDALGFVAHVPHYVAQVDYPAAAVLLLERLGGVAGLAWDLEPLRQAAAEREVEIAQQVAESEDVQAVVRGLEQQYDALDRGADAGLQMAEESDLPTAEELGAEFEQFLAGLDGEDD